MLRVKTGKLIYFYNFTGVEMTQLLSINIITELPLWFLLFCVALGGIYTFFLYRNEAKFAETPSWLVRLMAGARFLLVTILAFLLLSPFVKTIFNKIEKPVVIIAQDNSASLLLNKDSVNYQTKYIKDLNLLKEKLANVYEVKTYTFGENLKEGSAINFKAKTTAISTAFSELENKLYNRNVGALILASDGIFNQGANPVYTSEFEFPIYTIAMGDTAVQKDVLIKDVLYNKLTFSGNKFPLEVDVRTYETAGSETKLTVTKDGVEQYSKTYKIDNDVFIANENILLEADEVGVQHYKIELSSIDGEISLINNVKDVYIEILDGRQNVLILANAPHPDVKALKLSVEGNENYKVTHQLIQDFDGKMAPYSLAIIHQLPKVITPNLKKLLESNVSKLFILGNQTSISVFNQLNTGLIINNYNGRSNEILPEFAANFPLFTLSENTTQVLSNMPPILGPFGTFQMKADAYVLLNQKIGSVITNSPLLSFYQKEKSKNAVLTAEGIWKWRMQDFLRNGNHSSFDELINKIVQFLAVKEDKGKFRVFSENIYTENQEIRFDAELYNDSYELINEPDVTIDLQAEDGGEFDFVFSRTSNAYVLNAGILPPGFYNYKAKTKLGNAKYFESGKLQIKQLMLEANNTRANHQLMQNLAQKNNGKMFYPYQLKELSEALMANNDIASTIYEEEDLKELINIKLIFFLIIGLLSLEWFLRKRNGAY
ncbi:MAG: hypothetical protein ACPGSO_04410 [Vicingaceae bacterium]